MQPTNLLLINADQHSSRVFGAYGNPIVQTPNLDGLAARGTRFLNGYCPFPLCVPSRASLATGRYPHVLESWDNSTPYTGAQAASWGHRLTEQGTASRPLASCTIGGRTTRPASQISVSPCTWCTST